MASSQPTKKTNSRWFRINLWVHRWISLVIVLPFLILCLTGTVLIFHEEIDRLMGIAPEASVHHTTQGIELSDSLLAAQQKYPGEKIAGTAIDAKHFPGVLLIMMVKPGEKLESARLVFSEVATARLFDKPNPDSTLTGFLLRLHSEWFLGPIGQLLGALIALLVFLSLVSGLVVYAPYVKRFLFGIIRRQRGKRLLQLDLHNLMGSVVFGWAMVVTITGFLLGFSSVALGIWQLTELSDLKQKYNTTLQAPHTLSIDQIYQTAAQAEPGWEPTTVFYPDTEYSTKGHYLVLLKGASGLQERLLRVALINGNTGKVVTTLDLPFYLKTILAAQPLHFGDYGGMPLKILWTLCTWLTLFITFNGAWLWWAKRRQKLTVKEAG